MTKQSAEATADALPHAFSDFMRSCGIAKEIPGECGDVTSVALAREMQNEANVGMSRNAACDIDAHDHIELASLMTRIPTASQSSNSQRIEGLVRTCASEHSSFKAPMAIHSQLRQLCPMQYWPLACFGSPNPASSNVRSESPKCGLQMHQRVGTAHVRFGPVARV